MAARYIPASDQAEIGGDFYEAVAWQGKILVAIGDVQGHSLHAATVMGEIRHALRAFAIEGHPPLEITRLVNDVLQASHPDIIATLCLAVLDPVTGELELFNCGHIPPLMVDGDSAAYFGQGGPCSACLCTRRTSSAWSCRSERRPAPYRRPGRGPAILSRRHHGEAAARRPGRQPDGSWAFSNHLMSLFGPREDDVAMIAVRRSTS